MHNTYLNETETRPQRVDRIHFTQQIKVDCEGDYLADEIMKKLNDYNMWFFTTVGFYQMKSKIKLESIQRFITAILIWMRDMISHYKIYWMI